MRTYGLIALLLTAAAIPSHALGDVFDNSTDFTATVGAANLTTLDFEGLVTPPDTSIEVTDVDGVSFMTDGSDVILVNDNGVIQNAEQDRDMKITFPQPVTAVSVDMVFLDLFNDPTIGGTVRGEDGLGNEVFSASQPAGSFFFGYVNASQPITMLFLEPDGGGRSVVDTLQYAVVPEPGSTAIMLLGVACGVLLRRR